MEVAPQELAQLLKLAGVGAGPEPDMPEPEVSVMAIPSDDGAPVGGGCGAPEPEHNHPHDHDDMRSIIDMLQSSGDEPIEESPPKDDYENASKEFTGHPVDVVDTYDQFSYEPAKNSGMQRRTNSYGDNPLREEDLIKEYAEFKKFPLFEINWNNVDEVEAEYKRLGLDQGDDPLGGWWDTRGMSDLDIRKAREKRIKQAYKERPIDRQQDARIADKGSTGEEEAQAVALLGKDALNDPNWRDNVAAKKQADKEASLANIAAQKAERNRQAEIARRSEGEADAIAQFQSPTSKASQQQYKQAQDTLAGTTIAQSKSGETSPVVVAAKQKAAQQAANQAALSKAPDPNEIAQGKIAADKAIAGGPLKKDVAMTNINPELANQIKAQNPPEPKASVLDPAQKVGYGTGKVDPRLATKSRSLGTGTGAAGQSMPQQKAPVSDFSQTPKLGTGAAGQSMPQQKVTKKVKDRYPEKTAFKVTSSKYGDGMDRLKILAGI